ncbi:MAG: PAS domain-containing sensor histidine kinase [Acidobacteria bacterium]|nr:MAG: PAS domain-containing sensor histidine kinase [Acidobacteriota bacterium]
MTHQRRVSLLAVAAGLPGVVVALALLWGGDYAPPVRWTASVLVVGLWAGFALALRERVVLPLQTLANLLEALREGDYSIRARNPRADDALGEVMIEVNALGEVLRRQRFHAVDAATLLQQVIAEIDVAVFTFDGGGRLRLVNRAGERVMGRRAADLLARSAAELGLQDCLEGEATRTFERAFPGQSGRWQQRRSSFREGGAPHTLLVLTDLSKALRDEERQAWQRLIRVLGHELNNSLAPIKSTASTLESLLRREPLPAGWRADARAGLAIIAQRCRALYRFVQAYAQLARLPAPRRRPAAIGELVRRAAACETRLPVQVDGGPELTLEADGDQLEQLLINLIKNAVDATLEVAPPAAGSVRVAWRRRRGQLELVVRDDGPGLASTNNLFVPFFTTKPDGNGIGLVLSRQIAEAHGGTLELVNRPAGPGCEARLRLPL